MRKACLYLIFALGWLASKAQPFPTNTTRSPFTYIYKLSSKEVRKQHFSDMDKADLSLMHTLIDSFHFSADPPALPRGNYLLAHVIKTNWHLELYTVDDLSIFSFDKREGALLVLKKKNDEPITDALVKFGWRRAKFDSRLGGYVYKGRKQQVKVSINHNNVHHYISLFNGDEDEYYEQSVIDKMLRGSFIKRISEPFAKLFRKWGTGYRNKTTYYPGFLTYNKPVYRKNDTLRWKAFVTSSKFKPINKPLELRLIQNRYPVMDSLIAMVTPYRAGMFKGEFRLSDSMVYGQNYTLQLHDPKSKKVHLRSSFPLEDYMLSRMNLEVKMNHEELSPWKTGSLKVKLSDENELPIADGKLSITIQTNRRSVKSDQDGFFIKETLLQLQQDSDPSGNTEILLPDSIFPKATYEFTIHTVVRTASGEYKYTFNNGKYNNDSCWITFEPANDSVLVIQWKENKIDSALATLTYFNDDYDSLISYEGRLPMRIPLSAEAETLEAETDTEYEEWEPRRSDNYINCIGNRTKDSVWIKVTHPLGLPFLYSIYRNKKVVGTGTSKNLEWSSAAKEKELYLIDIHYLLSGHSYKNSYNIPFAENELKIFAEHPTKIEPGQEVPFTLKVRDAQDNPVAGADITAYAFTKKFSKSKLPTLRNYTRKYRVRKQRAHYNREEDPDRSTLMSFDPKNWMSRLGLDTINYFKFIYPDPYLRLLQPTTDSLTQIAPFLLERGNFKDVIQLDIDQKPVYMAGATSDNTYSFRVNPGYHNIRFRTMNAMVEIDSVEVIQGMKNNFSFNSISAWNKMKIIPMPDSFTVEEMELWRERLIQIKYRPEEELTYFKQKDHILTSSQITQENYNLSGVLSEFYGPVDADSIFIYNDSSRRFMPHETGFTHLITSDSTKKIKQPLPANFRLRSLNLRFLSNPPLGDRVLTDEMLRFHWDNLVEKRALQIASSIYDRGLGTIGGSLRINENYALSQNNKGTKLYLLLKSNEPDFLRIKSNSELLFNDLEAGLYRLLILFGNKNYIYCDSIFVRNDGISIANIKEKDLKQADTFIKSLREKIIRGLIDRSYNSNNNSNYNEAKQLINNKLVNTNAYKFPVSGKVVSGQDGSPIVFCSVAIKGTGFGTTTDMFGNFQLNCPEIAVLVFSAVGFESVERSVRGTSEFSVSMPPSVNRLQEVVVTALGVSTTKRELAFSIASVDNNQMLMGKVAGVSITVRGISSIEADNKTKIFVNGMLFNGTLNEIDSTQIENIIIVKADKAKSIYGTDGSEDIIDIKLRSEKTTAINREEIQKKENSIRSNFRDDAYWLPDLITDHEGKVHFRIRFPDDITSWRNQFVALTSKGQFGNKETFINAQKSLTASLLFPNFLLEGDRVKILGRSQYYGKDSIELDRSLTIGGKIFKSRGYIKSVLFDSSIITVNGADSVTGSYEINSGNNAYDGERRSIPVYKKGVSEDSGFFVALRKDTSFRSTIRSEKGTLMVRADKSVVPVLLDEIDQLDHYEYLCNEQLASKIIALLLKEKIFRIQKTDFKDEKKIRSMVRKLQGTANKEGLWGWWSNSTLSPWISKHVIDALVMARENGYGKEINFSRLTAVLNYELALQKGSDRLWYLEMLQTIGTKKIDDSLLRIESDTNLSLEEKIRWARLQLHNGQRPDLNFLWKYQLETTKGNPYWSTQTSTVFNNDVLLSASVYALLKSAGGYDSILQRLRYYFLEQRQVGSWRNTFESATVLQNILPDLLRDEAEGPAKLYINNKLVSAFPYQISITEVKELEVSYTGKQPVYLSAYQRNWNENPQQVSGMFTVNSYFSENGKTTSTLRKGDPVNLKVDVEVSGQTDYVMIEIPIPAGCTIQEKKSGAFNEVYREYYKDRVLIFFEKLQKGRLDFSITLLPQFSGNFSLNPAKAMEMYYPTHFGREKMKQIPILESLKLNQ